MFRSPSHTKTVNPASPCNKPQKWWYLHLLFLPFSGECRDHLDYFFLSSRQYRLLLDH